VSGSGVTVTLKVQVQSALLVTVRGRGLQVRLEDAGIGFGLLGKPGMPDAERGWQSSIVVNNNGNTHAQVTGDVQLVSGQGTNIASAVLGTGLGYVFPGAARRFIAQGREILGDGTYTVIAHVRALPGGARLSTSASFYVNNGLVSEGEPSSEVLEYLKLLNPRFRMQTSAKTAAMRPRASRIIPVPFTGTSETSLRLRPSLMDWSLDEQGNVLFAPAGTTSRSAVNSLSVLEDSLEARQGRQSIVRLRAQPPADAAGDYYAALVLVEEDATLPDDANMIRARACLITLAVEGAGAPQLEVAEGTVDSAGTPEGLFTVAIRNTGTVSCPVTGRIIVRDQSGSALDSISFGGPELVCLASGARRLQVPWTRALAAGRYVADVLVAPPGGKEAAKYQLSFDVPGLSPPAPTDAAAAPAETTEPASGH
jgi:hypothetical protein